MNSRKRLNEVFQLRWNFRNLLRKPGPNYKRNAFTLLGYKGKGGLSTRVGYKKRNLYVLAQRGGVVRSVVVGVLRGMGRRVGFAPALRPPLATSLSLAARGGLLAVGKRTFPAGLWSIGGEWIYNLGVVWCDGYRRGAEEDFVSTTEAEYRADWALLAWDKARVVAVIVALLGVFVAGYMAWAEATNNETVCADTGSIDCAAVQESAYAETWGIPVAFLGLAGYVAILAVLVLEDQIAFLAAYGRSLVVAMTLFGVMFQTYLTYIEADVLHKWCQWCVASYVLITTLFVLGVYRLYGFLRPLRR